jgi:cyclomaltodextrinase / maltogenic alpha-amylase / neopullulanase
VNLAALFHQNHGATAYALDAHHLRVVLHAAAGDLTAATVITTDRYAGPRVPEVAVDMERAGSDGTRDYWAATVPTATRRVSYRFCVRAGRAVRWLGETGAVTRKEEATPFQFPYLCTADLFRQPAWLAGVTFYQVFPDRFCNGDPTNDPRRSRLRWGDRPRGGAEMAGGDLEGVRKRLEYLAELGVGGLYMTPIFRSSSNHKYNTADYFRVDPAFGTNELFVRLVQEAHASGIRVLLDAVFNHSGDGFFAFRDVRRKGAASRYVSWFHRIDSFPVDPSLPTYETFATGLGYMPKLNTADPACAEYFLRVAERWIRAASIDGWRLDVANEVDHAFWRSFRRRVKAAKSDAWILGEVWHDAQAWLQGDEFDSVTNYPWRDAVLGYLSGRLDATRFDGELQRLRYRDPAPITAGLLSLLGSHDTPRVRTLLAGDPADPATGAEGAALAAVLLFTAPGVPLVYYGDEIGMEGGPDPDNRRCMEWDPERQDPDTLALYRKLIALRRRYPWLNDGAWETLLADPVTGVYAFRRDNRRMLGALPPDGPAEHLWVALNPSYSAHTARLTLAPDGATGRRGDGASRQRREGPAVSPTRPVAPSPRLVLKDWLSGDEFVSRPDGETIDVPLRPRSARVLEA